MRQALEILQMPQLELSQWLLAEIEKNPLLELDDAPRGKKRFEGDFPAKPTLYEHLLKQIRECFSDDGERKEAVLLLQQIDERGFLPESAGDGKVISLLQSFDPPGIFARNLQECFLLQLKAKGQTKTLAYELVKRCYDDLLHGRFCLIKKKLRASNLKETLIQLSRLSLRPAEVFHEEISHQITPDLSIQRIDGGWTLELIEDDLPRFHRLHIDIEGEKEEREVMRSFKVQAKWIFRSLNRRRKLLQELGRALLCKQAAFLDQKGPLLPIRMQELAQKLEIHESTLSRALHGKFAATPRGIIPLKSLISSDPESTNAKLLLEKLIASEDKSNPLTDDQLANALKEKGIQIARRTIAKYRKILKIASCSQRKLH